MTEQVNKTKKAAPPETNPFKRAWNWWKKIARKIGDFNARVILTIFYLVPFLPFAALGVMMGFVAYLVPKRRAEARAAAEAGAREAKNERTQDITHDVDGCHFFTSCSCSELARSIHSPLPSWISSFRLICTSSMPVMTPKFCPM